MAGSSLWLSPSSGLFAHSFCLRVHQRNLKFDPLSWLSSQVPDSSLSPRCGLSCLLPRNTFSHPLPLAHSGLTFSMSPKEPSWVVVGTKFSCPLDNNSYSPRTWLDVGSGALGVGESGLRPGLCWFWSLGMWKEGLGGKARQGPCELPTPSPPHLDDGFVQSNSSRRCSKGEREAVLPGIKEAEL